MPISSIHDTTTSSSSCCANIPYETLGNIFSYLDLVQRNRIRFVCQAWSHSFADCGYFIFIADSNKAAAAATREVLDNGHFLLVHGTCTGSTSSTWCSKENQLKHIVSSSQSKPDNDNSLSSRVVLKHRTKGHLPEPTVFLNGSSTPLVYHCSNNKHSSGSNGSNGSSGSGMCFNNINNINNINGKSQSSQIHNSIQYEKCCQAFNIGKENKKKYALDNKLAMVIQFQYLINLDLSNTKWGYGYHLPHPQYDSSFVKGKSKLQILDVSCLNQLQRLSVKGCSKLKILRTSSSSTLHALDASACISLVEIDMRKSRQIVYFTNKSHDTCNGDHNDDRNNQHRHRHRHHPYQGQLKQNGNLKALNLNGCRSLSHASFLTNGYSFNIQELDLTSVTRLSAPIIEKALRNAIHLESLSLRYVATDKIIAALGLAMEFYNSKDDNDQEEDLQEVICRSGVDNNDDIAVKERRLPPLKLIDLAFSFVSDISIEKLVNTCIRLERCNLRGCKNISTECYNQTPIYLKQRQDSGGSKSLFSFDNGSSHTGTNNGSKRRKGDNVFYFL